MSILIVKNILFLIVIIYASYCDIKTRIIPDKVHVMIMILALIKIDWIPSIIGLILVPLPFLVVALYKEGSMGGGDIKFVAACSFFMGFYGGLFGSIIGLSFVILTNMLYFRYKVAEYNGKFAIVPYLGIGYVLISFLLKIYL
ncbi:A24 family peptidase [Clostridiaceae bacterium M8S5]|nr:A24 family peptidase [Clostridiaceae bacterium M8S5]